MIIDHQDIEDITRWRVLRYEFYVRVAWTISHEWAQRTSEILFLPREHKIHIFKLTCNVLFIININLLMTAFLTIFWRFLTTFRRFPKNCSEGQTNISEHFPRISKNFRRYQLSKDSRRCFDDTPTNLSTIKETNFIQWNHRYLHMWR